MSMSTTATNENGNDYQFNLGDVVRYNGLTYVITRPPGQGSSMYVWGVEANRKGLPDKRRPGGWLYANSCILVRKAGEKAKPKSRPRPPLFGLPDAFHKE